MQFQQMGRSEGKQNGPSAKPPATGTGFLQQNLISSHFIDIKWLKYMASSLSFFSICSRQASEVEIILKI